MAAIANCVNYGPPTKLRLFKAGQITDLRQSRKHQVSTRNQAAIALLQSWREGGNAAEQQAEGAQIETFLAEDGLSDRRAYPAG